MGIISTVNAMALSAWTHLYTVLGDDWAGNVQSHGNISGGDNADVSKLLNNAGSSFEYWAAVVVMILGVAALLVGTYMLVTGLISHGKKQTSWIVVILLFVVGGILLFGGWGTVGEMVQGLRNTVSTWAS